MEKVICKHCKQEGTQEKAVIPLGNVQDINCEVVHEGCYQEYMQAQSERNILLEDIKETFAECLEIAKKKNNDYAGEKTKDPYKNLRGSVFVKVSPDRAILVRIIDKISRVSNLLEQDNQVKDESIQDTINDCINYFAILKSYIKNERPK